MHHGGDVAADGVHLGMKFAAEDAVAQVDEAGAGVGGDFPGLVLERFQDEDAGRFVTTILDNLRRAVAHAAEAGTEEFFVSGLELVVREFETALERLGVVRVPAVGERFDPAIHEAIAGEESDDVNEDTVIDELVPGYRLHDRLLRPAIVRVVHPRHVPTAS